MSSPFVAFHHRGAGWLESRDDTTTTTSTSTSTWTIQGGSFNQTRFLYQTATNQTQHMFFNELRFAAAKSIRTSTIILASFNMVAAFATAVGILCDSYFRSRRNRRLQLRPNGFWDFVPEGELYPLILSIAIVIQSATFAGAQSTGLKSLFGLGCTTMAQLMLPAVFLVPYIQLVFAVEIAIRGLKKSPFAPRGKYDVSICLAIVGLLTLAKFLVAGFDRSPNFCLTSLFWFVAHYSVMCFGLFVSIAAIILGCIVVVFTRLYRSIKVEVTARVSASKMIYYMAHSVISLGFMIPFFFVQGFRDRLGQPSNALTLAMVASVVANVSGLMTGGLYLFLKSSTLSTIGPMDKAGEYEDRQLRYKIQRVETSDDDRSEDFDFQITHPVGRPGRFTSESTLINTEKEEEAALDSQSAKWRRTPESTRSSKLAAMAAAILPKAPQPARIPAAASIAGHMRKRSYSLFPKTASRVPGTTLPATTYVPTEDDLKPPPSMANLVNTRHKRDSSLVSSATVQIGLRLSSVDDIPPAAATTPDNVVHTLDCPNLMKEKGMTRPQAVVFSPTTATSNGGTNVQDEPVKDARMKTLPPVPKLDTAVGVAVKVDQPLPKSQDEVLTLSSSVYTPVSGEKPAKQQEVFTLSPTVYTPPSPSKKTKQKQEEPVTLSPTVYTPSSNTPKQQQSKQEPVTLSPTVYTPPFVEPKPGTQPPPPPQLDEPITLTSAAYKQTTPTTARVKLPSPKGVGFSMPVPKRSASSTGTDNSTNANMPKRTISNASSHEKTLPRRATSNTSTRAQQPALRSPPRKKETEEKEPKGGDWI